MRRHIRAGTRLATILLAACGSRSQLDVPTREVADASPASPAPLGISCPQTSVQRDAPWPTPARCPDNRRYLPVPALVAPHVAWTTPVGHSQEGMALPFLLPGVIGADGVIHLQVKPDSFSINSDGSIRERTPGGGIPAGIGADGALYAYDSGSRGVSALHPDGSVEWTLPNVTPGDFTFGDDATDYILEGGYEPYCPTTGSVIAIRPDGSTLWTVASPCSDGYPASLRSPAVGADGTVYFASDTGDHVRPSAHVEAVAAGGTVRWSNDDSGDPVMVGLDGTAYVALYGGGTVAYAPDGSHRWETDRSGPMAARPDGDVLLLDQHGGNLYDFHPDGSTAWVTPLARSLNPTVVDGAMYMTSTCYPKAAGCTSGITALSWQGEPLWTVDGLNPVWIIVGKSAIYALSVDVDTWDFSLVAVSD